MSPMNLSKYLLATSLFSAVLTGCNGGGPESPAPTPTAIPTRTPTPAPNSFAGTYVGTYNVTYDPRSPLSGSFSGALRFVVSPNGTVVAERLFPDFPIDEARATGRVVGTSLSASGSSLGFGLRSLSGRLRISAGRASGSGSITIVSQSELAYGTWQAQRRP